MDNKARHYKWAEMPFEQLNDHIQRRFVHGESIMLTEFRLARGAVIPRHSHHNEQVSYILEGSLKFWVGAEDEQEIVVNAGEVIHLPAHLPHRAEAEEDCVALDLFSPPREDWINREDAYLRG